MNDRSFARWGWGGALAGLAALVYLPAIRAGFVWDDAEHFSSNPLMESWGGLARIWTEQAFYYPLTSTTFWIERRLWGLSPAPYHLVNILLHAANAILLWRLLERLRVPAAWLGAALFAAHPINVQSVAWATELKNVQSGFFYLASLIASVRYEESGRGRALGASLALFVLALLSKTSTVTLPAVLVLIRFWRGGALNRKFAAKVAPFFAVAAAASLLTVVMHRKHVDSGLDWGETFPQRLVLVGRCFWFYWGKLAAPIAPCFVYPKWSVEAGSAAQWIPTAAMMVAAAALGFSRRRGGKAGLVVFAYCLVSLLPVLNLFRMYYTRYSYVADHWAYLASMGALAFFAACAGVAAERVRLPARWRLAGAACLIALLGALSARQAGAYRSMETLWADTLAKNPGAWIAQNHLAAAAIERGELDEAEARLKRSLAAAPENYAACFNYGSVMFRRGDLESAAAWYARAYNANRRHYDSLTALGKTRLKQGRAAEAIEALEVAAKLKPDSAEIRQLLGYALAAARRFPEALAQLDEALRLAPTSMDARANRAGLLADMGRADEAIAEYGELLRVDPSNADAHFNLAVTLSQRGRAQEAAEHAATAARLRPGDGGAWSLLGQIHEAQGRREEAASAYREAFKQNPGDAALKEKLEGMGAR